MSVNLAAGTFHVTFRAEASKQTHLRNRAPPSPLLIQVQTVQSRAFRAYTVAIR